VGGTGKSTLAETLAWMLACEGGGTRRVLLLSLGNPPAAVSHFKLSRWPHVGLFLEGEEPFERVVQRLPLPLPSSGNSALSVAIAPGDLALYDRIGGRMPDAQGAVMRVVEAARAHFEIVIADLPPDLSGWAVHPLLAAGGGDGDIVIVARPTVAGQAGVVQATTLVQSLGRGAACRLHLVLNDYYRGQDLGPKDFVTGVNQMLACPPLAAVVPHGGNNNNIVRLAQNEGLALPLAEGTDGVVEGVRRLGRAIGFGFEVEAEAEVKAEVEAQDRGRLPGSGGVRAGRKRPGFSLPGIRIKVTD
jgi:cellulose biosynthesis protein BcsQ